MKINIVGKALIGSMVLSSCQKPVQNIVHQRITPIVRTIDTFTPTVIPTNSNPEKTFNLVKGIAKFFSNGANMFNLQAGTKSTGISARPKTVKKKSAPAVKKKQPVRTHQKSKPIMPVQRKITSTLDGGNYWFKGENISYAHPTEYTVEGSQRGVSIANANGVSMYRLKLANPDIDFEKPVLSGTIVKIPGKYVVEKGSVKSFDDVVATTKINKHYIKDILIGIEGRKQKPDLVCKSDNVRSKQYPYGCPTIGFGHTGRVDGEVIVNGRTRITEEKAYELLAQDILDAKLDAMVYMGKPLFENAPESVQTGIIDIVFNKGVEAFSRQGSPTTMIKADLEKKDFAAAAAHTVLKTGNRGLKKRNVYRTIMSTTSLTHDERLKSLSIAKPHYIETLNKFPGKGGHKDRTAMQTAWSNAKKGITHGFFNK